MSVNNYSAESSAIPPEVTQEYVSDGKIVASAASIAVGSLFLAREVFDTPLPDTAKRIIALGLGFVSAVTAVSAGIVEIRRRPVMPDTGNTQEAWRPYEEYKGL